MSKSATAKDSSRSSKKGRGKYSAVFGCNNSAYDVHRVRTKYHFFEFPKDTKGRNRWCNRIKRRHGKVQNQCTLAGPWRRSTESLHQKESIRKHLNNQKIEFYKRLNFLQPAGSTEPVSLSAHISAAGTSGFFSSGHAQTEMESLQIDQTESDIVLRLQRKIVLLETQQADCQQRLKKAEKENMYLLEHQFSLAKIKDDNAAKMTIL